MDTLLKFYLILMAFLGSFVGVMLILILVFEYCGISYVLARRYTIIGMTIAGSLTTAAVVHLFT